ncbi:hypothetical protein D3C87_1826900 [compost metagenome]
MITDDEIHRINHLARKAKAEGLSEEEKAEQHALRMRYVAAVKRSLKGHLDHIRPEEAQSEQAPPA